MIKNENKNKTFYWIKLRTDFFNKSQIDFILGQKNGCEYIVLYQMLCLNTANTNGNLSYQIGEMLVPYDVNKIVRDTKYFDYDTVVVALELFKKLGLIYIQKNDTLQISNFEEMVGKETSSAKRMREMRSRNKASLCDTRVTPNVTQEIEIENRDKSIEKDNKIYTITCHLNFDEKQESCLNCLKLKKCNKKTNNKFLNKYKVNVEDYKVENKVKSNEVWNGKKIEVEKLSKEEIEDLNYSILNCNDNSESNNSNQLDELLEEFDEKKKEREKEYGL